MNLTNLLQSSYWFSQPEAAVRSVRWVSLGLFLLLCLGGLVLIYLRNYRPDKAERAVFGRLSTWSLTVGIIGLLWFSFRQEKVLFLGWRFWWVFWGIIFLAWLYKIVYYLIKRLPQIKVENKERKSKEKYLPKQK